MARSLSIGAQDDSDPIVLLSRANRSLTNGTTMNNNNNNHSIFSNATSIGTHLRGVDIQSIIASWKGPIENGSLTEFLPSSSSTSYANSSRRDGSSLLSDALAVKRHSCQQCHHPCNTVSKCHNAVKCFTTSHRGIATGGSRYSRGCIDNVDAARMLCRSLGSTTTTTTAVGAAAASAAPAVQHVSSTAVYHTSCCGYELCNNGSFPLLPPEKGSAVNSSLLLAWLAPLLLLLLLLVAALVLWRQRSPAARAKRHNTPDVLSTLVAPPPGCTVAPGAAATDTRWRDGRRRRCYCCCWLRNTFRRVLALISGGRGDNMRRHRAQCGAGGATHCRSDTGLERETLFSDRSLTEGTSLKELLEVSMTSGSGSGLPLLVQRTLAKEVLFCELVGRGRYGEVWKAIWHKEPVAVKIFYSRDEASWTRETQIYNTVLLRHANVLGYLGSDMMTRGSCTQLLLVTSYYAAGSLYDQLARHTLTTAQLVTLLLSAANGLSHLHTEIHGSQGKPAIAHRDVKSKNVLVRADGQAVIADLGLAVTSSGGRIDLGHNLRVGTKRYMSPELLDNRLRADNFEALLKCDMYAFGLLMWEAGRRCTASGRTESARVPYDDIVPSDPGFDEMRKIVCVDRQRPTVPNHWHGHAVLTAVARLMKECWHHDPQVRLSALRVKKSLAKISANLHLQLSTSV